MELSVGEAFPGKFRSAREEVKRWDRLALVSKVGSITGSFAAVSGIPCVLDKGEGVSVVMSLPVGHPDVVIRGLDRSRWGA